MKSKPFNVRALSLFVLLIGLSAGLMAWGYTGAGDQYYHAGDFHFIDTPPAAGKEKKIRDLDEAIEETDRAMEKLDKEFRDIDWDKFRREMEASLSKIDAEKIQAEVRKAMKEVDIAKIKADVEAALAKVDGEKMQSEITKAIKEIDLAKIKEEVMASLKEIDMDKIKTEIDMEKLKEEMKGLEKELQKIGPEVKKSLEGAREEIQKAKAELQAYKSFVDGLEKDGLISKKKGYTLEHKNGELLINGKKQPEDVYNKYRSFLDKHKRFTLKNEDDDFNIDID